MTEIKNQLKELGFSNNETKIYIALTELGEAKASIIAKKCSLPRTTVISVLSVLEKQKYLSVHKHHNTSYYWIESPKIIKTILENKIEIADRLDNLLTDLYRKEAHFPTTQIYDTRVGIKNFIEKMISDLTKKSIIYTIDAPKSKNYSRIFNKQVEDNIIRLKFKREIITKTLIQFDSFKEIPKEKLKTQNIQIKELPKNIDFEASLWIIKDSLIHFSGTPPFIIVIKHEKIVSGIKSIYEFLWNISTPKN